LNNNNIIIVLGNLWFEA